MRQNIIHDLTFIHPTSLEINGLPYLIDYKSNNYKTFSLSRFIVTSHGQMNLKYLFRWKSFKSEAFPPRRSLKYLLSSILLSASFTFFILRHIMPCASLRLYFFIPGKVFSIKKVYQYLLLYDFQT